MVRRAGSIDRHGISQVESFGEAEVQDFDLSLRRQLHIRGLQVAMNDSALVRVLETLAKLPGDRQRFVDRYRTARNTIGQRLPLDQFHHQRTPVIRLFEPVYGGDIGMIERGEDLGFALEASHAFGVGSKRFRQDL